MATPPSDSEFERRFIAWYVWASKNISFDPRRCRAAAWAAATSTGTHEELVAIAQKAANGPELDELAGKPDPGLAARADEAARAKPLGRGWVRTCGIIAAVLGVLLLLAGGTCFALIAISSSSSGSGP